MSSLRIGILGAGFTGGKHAANLVTLDGVEVAAVCDSDRARAEALCGKVAPDAEIFADHRAMYASGRLDAVYVCLPPFTHTDEVEQAAERGMHVFIEKPIAINSDVAKRMVDAVESAGVVSQVGYMVRYSGAVRKLAALLADGSAGKPTLFRGSYSCNALHSPWWRDREKSGGQIFEQAIHVYDLALAFLGRPTRVGAAMGNLCHAAVDGYTVEDTSASVIEFESGAIASIAASNCAVPGKWLHEFTLICERLTASVRGGNEIEIVHTGGSEPRVERATYDDDPFAAEDAAFIDAIRGQVPQTVPMRVGYDGVRLVEAAVHSSADGVFVRL